MQNFPSENCRRQFERNFFSEGKNFCEANSITPKPDFDSISGSKNQKLERLRAKKKKPPLKMRSG
jgi:hypothetical protein